MLEIRRSRDRLIFNRGIPIPGKTDFVLRLGRDYCMQSQIQRTVVIFTTFVDCCVPLSQNQMTAIL